MTSPYFGDLCLFTADGRFGSEWRWPFINKPSGSGPVHMSSKNALANLIELTSNVANAYTTALYVADLETGVLTLRSQLTLSSHFSTDTTYAIGEGMLGQVALHKKPRLDDFSGADASSLEWYTAPEEIKGLMVVPVVRQELEGVLVVDSKENYSFTPKLQKLICGFADQMGWYLSLEKENPNWIDGAPADFQQMLKWCRFLSEAPHRKALSERFLHIPRSLMQCDAAAVIWFENDSTGRVTHSKGWKQSLKSLSIQSGTGICGSCLDNGQSLLVPNTMNQSWIVFAEGEPAESFGSIMAAPIASDKRMLGLVVCATHAVNGLKREDLDKLTLMTTFAASAVSPTHTSPQADQIFKPKKKNELPSQHFLPFHLKAFEAEILKREAPVSVISIRIGNADDLFKTDRQQRSELILDQISIHLADKVDLLKLFMRYSDEGLVLLLISVNEQEACTLEDSIQNDLSKVTFTLEGNPMKVELEYGLASFPIDGSDLKELIDTSWARTTRSKEKAHG